MPILNRLPLLWFMMSETSFKNINESSNPPSPHPTEKFQKIPKLHWSDQHNSPRFPSPTFTIKQLFHAASIQGQTLQASRSNMRMSIKIPLAVMLRGCHSVESNHAEIYWSIKVGRWTMRITCWWVHSEKLFYLNKLSFLHFYSIQLLYDCVYNVWRCLYA